MFHVGQLIICIRDGSDKDRSTPLRKGAIYTVKSVGSGFWHNELIDVLLLIEIAPPSGHCGFAGPCFRPITEQRLAVFRDLLAPVPTERVDA